MKHPIDPTKLFYRVEGQTIYVLGDEGANLFSMRVDAAPNEASPEELAKVAAFITYAVNASVRHAAEVSCFQPND